MSCELYPNKAVKKNSRIAYCNIWTTNLENKKSLYKTFSIILDDLTNFLKNLNILVNDRFWFIY